MAGELSIGREDTYQARLARLEALLDAVPAPFAVLESATARLVLTNRRFFELTGIAAGALSEPPLRQAFPNADGDLREAVDEAIQGKIHSPLRLTVRRGDRIRVLEAAIRALGEELPPRELVFAAVDVTEREQLREDLAHLVGQLTSIFGVIPDAVRVYDVHGNVVRANAQAIKDCELGTSATLAAQIECEQPRTLDDVPVRLEHHPTYRALRGEAVRSEMLRVIRASSGPRVIEVSANPLHDDIGEVRGAVTVVRDVTDRLALVRELEEKARQIDQLYARASTETERLERMVAERTAELLAIQDRHARERRLAAIGQLAAGVMHDVNNALNPIMAAAYLLDRHADDPNAVREYAARIARAAETGAATSARVGRFIRQDPIDEGTQAQLDLGTLASEVVAMMRSLWAERQVGGPIRLELRLASAPAVGVAGEVRAAIMNLINNALDATAEGGAITVETRTDGVDSVVEVSDTGVGMTEHVREHAFEPFFSTKEGTGSGLGLAEVYGIMRRHRGSAEIISEPGAGATVRLRFRTQSVTTRDTPASVPSAGSRRRILLVEDNEAGREFFRMVLQSHGHEVESVATYGEGLSRLEAAAADPFEVLISDIGLPDGSGWDLVRKARVLCPGMRIGVVTGWEGNREGPTEADFVLRKPVPPAELIALVGVGAT
ncbi:MAG TPA: ATP-binding protein [Gemmatimonadaceae bacterium]|nr:ATP-binding protein [Gemmatimonadaceae bacterium]